MKLLETESLSVIFKKTTDILQWYGWTNRGDTFHPDEDGPRNLLMALQQSCGSRLSYVACVGCLAKRLGLNGSINDALGIVLWENSASRTFEDIEHLLSGEYVC